MGTLDRWKSRHPERSRVATNGKLAQTLLDRWKGRKAPTTAVNLKNRLSDLDRGRTTWWEKPDNRPLLEALAKVLGASAEELLDRPPEVAGATSFPVSEWPEVGPIELRGAKQGFINIGFAWPGVGDGQPVPMSEVVETRKTKEKGAKPDTLMLTENDLEGQFGPIWVRMPSGAGRSLIAAFHAARFGREIDPTTRRRHSVRGISVERLRDALVPPLEGERTTIVDLQRFDPQADALDLVSACRRGGLIVLSPAALPPSAPRASGSNVFAWNEYTWRPFSEWRETLIYWLSEHFHEPFEGDWRDLATSLWFFDGFHRNVRTPREFLQLARVWRTLKAADSGRPVFEPAARELIRTKLRHAALDETSRLWAEAVGESALFDLLAARWKEGADWGGAQNIEQWRACVPPSLLGAAAGSAADATRATVIERLVRAGLLVEEGESGLACSSTLVEHVAGRRAWTDAATEALRRKGETGSLAALGRHSLGPARRHVVDNALDRLEDDVFWALVELVAPPVKEKGSPELGLAALADALFLAVGRRLNRSPKLSAAHARSAGRLFARVWPKTLRRGDHVACSLGTRPGPGSPIYHLRTPDEVNRYVFATWAWSFSLSAPPSANDLDKRDRWLFPGWFDALEGKDPTDVAVPSDWEMAKKHVLLPQGRPWPSLLLLSEYADRVAEKVVRGAGEGVTEIPPVLRGAVVVRVALRDVPLQEQPSLHTLGNGRWLEDLVTRVESLPEDDARRVASYIFREMTHQNGTPETESIVNRFALLSRVGPLGNWVLARLTVADLEARMGGGAGLHDADIRTFIGVLQTVPPAFRQWLLDRALETETDTKLLGSNLWHPDWRDPEVLESLIRRFPDKASWPLGKLWSRAPARAAELTREWIDGADEELVRQSIRSSGVENAAYVLPLLERFESVAPDWLQNWVHGVVLRGGPEAERAWSVLRRR